MDEAIHEYLQAFEGYPNFEFWTGWVRKLSFVLWCDCSKSIVYSLSTCLCMLGVPTYLLNVAHILYLTDITCFKHYFQELPWYTRVHIEHICTSTYSAMEMHATAHMHVPAIVKHQHTIAVSVAMNQVHDSTVYRVGYDCGSARTVVKYVCCNMNKASTSTFHGVS